MKTLIMRMLERIAHPRRTYEERETVDHLAGSDALDIIRPRSPEVARERTLRTIRAHGSDSATASPALRKAAERHFGSWTNALLAAGMFANVSEDMGFGGTTGRTP